MNLILEQPPAFGHAHMTKKKCNELPRLRVGKDSEGITAGDRRRKATMEQMLQGVEAIDQVAPWKMGWQMNERNLVWNNDLKLRLKKVCNKEGNKNGCYAHHPFV